MKNNNPIWKKILADNEEVKYEFSVGSTYITVSTVVWCLLSGFLGFFPVPLVLFYFLFYVKKANVYGLTNKRILIHKGWLSTSLTSVDYSKITDTFVSEPFLDKLIFKTGNLAVNTAGSGSDEIILKHIASPYEVKKKIDSFKD